MKRKFVGICRAKSSFDWYLVKAGYLIYFTSSKTTNYNNVYPTFYVRGYELMSMFGATGSQADLPLVENNIYKAQMKKGGGFVLIL